MPGCNPTCKCQQRLKFPPSRLFQYVAPVWKGIPANNGGNLSPEIGRGVEKEERG